jgi:D-glycero-alpha-D-manno-heptose-7-phosphate kinase
MIIVRSPLRISIGGGGTDLKSYYSQEGGFLVAAAIDKYVYISLSKRFTKGLLLKYSKIENCQSIDEIEHPIFREVLKVLNPSDFSLEIDSMADIPSGTGLGSSGSFTTALIKAISSFDYKVLRPNEVAELACHVEIDRLGEPIGKQDQYIASYGGVTSFTFNKDGSVLAKPLQIERQTIYDLEDNLLLFFTGFSRSAGAILKDQNVKSQSNDREMIENLNYVKELGFRSQKLLESGKLLEFGELMHEHWEHKKRRSGGMSNPKIDEWYKLAMDNGAIGGKLVGAGGGGFLMFMAKDRNQLRKVMTQAGLEEVRFKFDFEGTKVMMSS